MNQPIIRYPELPMLSLYEQNKRLLSNASGKPFLIIGSSEHSDYVCEHGTGLQLVEHDFYYMSDTIESSCSIPTDEVALVGYDAIDAYVNHLFDRTERGEGMHHAVTSLTVIDLYPSYFEPIPESVYDEVAKRILTNPPNTSVDMKKLEDFTTLVETIIGAPEALTSRIYPTLRRRALECKTFEDIRRDPLVYGYIDIVSSQRGITEIAALHELIDTTDSM